jgi:hypothetical protein
VTKQGVVARWLRSVLPLIAPWAYRPAPVRRYLFRVLSQIRINYRNSPLSMGSAGRVLGGDRLPWVETEPGKDNFIPLASLTWQVHVYGQAPPGLAGLCTELQLPFHQFAWRPEMRRAGLLRSALYLVRPDGHVALADQHADPGQLRDYLSAIDFQRFSLPDTA